jgi:multidrug efflux pump
MLLILSAQYASYVDPAVLLLTVPLAVFGGLLGLAVAGDSRNLYSQIGIVMLIGIAAKHGILLVEFANQLLAEGVEFSRARVEASCLGMRPIRMTGLSTALGAVPLLVASGAGANSRLSLGVVSVSGVLFPMMLTLFVVPVFFLLLGQKRGLQGFAPGGR